MSLLRSLLSLSLLVGFLATVPAAQGQDCTTEWAAPVDGAWGNTSNWTNGVPGADSAACITVPGTYTVTFSGPTQALQHLEVGGANGTQTVVVAGTFSSLGSGRVGQNGRLLTVSSANCAACDGLPLITGTLLVEGELVHTGNARLIRTSGTVDIAPGGTLRLVYEGGTAAQSGGPASLFRIRGSIEADCAPLACSINSPVEVDGGAIRVTSGGLHMRRTGSLKDVTFDAAEDATLQFNGNQVPSAERVFTVEGTMSGNPEGEVNFVGVDLDAGENVVTFDMGGTGMRFSGVNLRATALTGTTGSFVNVNVMELGLLAVSSWGQGVRGVTLRNEGSLEFAPNITLWDEAVIENAAGATVRMKASAQIFGEGAFENFGLLLRDVGGPNSRMRVPYHGRPGSTVAVLVGQITLENGGSFDGGSFDVAEGATLWVRGLATERLLWTLDGTLSGEIGGIMSWFGADFAAGPSNPVLNFTGEGLQFSGEFGRVTQFTNGGGTLTNVGRIQVAGSSGFGIGSRGATVLNEGLIELIFPFMFWEDGVLRNQPNGAIRMVNSGFSVVNNNGIVENHGLIERNGDAVERGFAGTLRSMPGSELRVLTGGLHLDPPGDHSFPEGTTVTGTAPVRLIADLVVGGTVSPGTAEQPIATQEFVSSLHMGPTARTVIDIAANGESDTIIPASGSTSTTLNGTLVVRPAPGFTPNPGDEWVIFLRSANPTNIPGDFHTIEVEGDLPDDLSFVTVKPNAGVVVLRAVAGVTIEALASSTTEGGAPVEFVVTAAQPVEPGSVLNIPISFEGSAQRYVNFMADVTGGMVRIPGGRTQTRINVTPLQNNLQENQTITLRLLEGGDAALGEPSSATITLQPGPPVGALAVGGISPSVGGRTGRVTASIFGQGFSPGAQVRLVGGGGTVTGTGVVVSEDGRGLVAEFDLGTAAVGVYDVVVDASGGSESAQGAFRVEEGRTADIWIDLNGTPNPRLRRWTTYTLTMGNAGNSDVYDTKLLLRVSPGVEIELPDLIVSDFGQPGTEQFAIFDVGTAQVIPLYVYHLAAGESSTFRVRVRPTGAIGTGVGVSYEYYPPNPSALFTWSGDFDDVDLDQAAGVPTNYSVLGGAVRHLMEQQSQTRSAGDAHGDPVGDPADGSGRAGGLNNDWSRPDSDLSMNELMLQYSSAHNFNTVAAPVLRQVLPSPSSVLRSMAFGVATAAAVHSGGFSLVLAAAAAEGANEVSDIVSVGPTVLRHNQLRGMAPPDRSAMVPLAAPRSTTGGPGGGPSGGMGGGAGGKAGGAVDPNDKLGPAGYAAQRYTQLDQRILYTIRFENLETASFPAQEVFIIDDLDMNVFDLSTFSLGAITLPDRVLTPPPGLQQWDTTVDLAPELPAVLRISTSLNTETGRATWTFATIDPTTNDLPEDGLVGFLPPNVNQPEGEGAVAFSIEPRPNLATGTEAANFADIVFDLNEPIITPVWSNVVDRDAPVTFVEALDLEVTSPFQVRVAGSDAGAGIYLYSLYVSEDGGPFELVGTSDSPLFEFEGEIDRTYGFYSRAVDYVFNPEGPKTEAEAVTAVVVSTDGGSELPTVLTLGVPYPNPSRTNATVRVGLPTPEHLDVRVYDLLGREVVRLVDEERSAGWHLLGLDSRSLAAGVYIVRVNAGHDTRTQRLVVVN